MNETEYKASELTDFGNVTISRLEGSGKSSLKITFFFCLETYLSHIVQGK